MGLFSACQSIFFILAGMNKFILVDEDFKMIYETIK